MSDTTLPVPTQVTAPVTAPAETPAAPVKVEEAVQTKQSTDAAPAAVETKPAPERKPRSMSETQWRERENAFNARLSESESKVKDLEARLAAGAQATTGATRDAIDDMLEELGDDPTAKALKRMEQRLESLEKENGQLRQVTAKSRTEYWQDHYTRVFEQVKEEFPHIDFDEFVQEFSKIPQAELPKTDAFEFAKRMNEREEKAYERRVDARKDQILSQWGFAAGQAPAKVEAQAETRAAAELGKPGKVADKFAPKVGQSARPVPKKDEPDYLRYNSPEASKELAARIMRQNSGRQAN